MSMTASAKQMLSIVINKGSDNPISIAVVPFYWDSFHQLPVDTAVVIAENMKLSGLFKTMNHADMISYPHKAEDILVNDWKRLGIQYVVYGSITRPKGSGVDFDVKYGVYDVNNGKNLLSDTSSGRYLDAIANKASDRVYERLTGVKGFFSTKLLYITSVPSGEGEIVYRLQMADANGRNVKTILTSTDPIMSPSWSPDGQDIAYVSFQNDKPNVFIQDTKSGKQTLISDHPGINSAPDWSPNGRQLAMVLSKDGNPELYLYHVRTKQLQRLTRNAAIDTEPRWAPDGKSLIFTSNRGGSPQIYQMTLHDRQVKRLTFEGKYNARGQLTPDGKHLVFVHQSTNKEFHIAALSLETSLMRSLTKTELDESPSIAPNGSMIVYATQVNKQSVLRMVTIDGNIEMEVPATQGQLREPAWSPFLY
jgi:TolB protein